MILSVSPECHRYRIYYWSLAQCGFSCSSWEGLLIPRWLFQSNQQSIYRVSLEELYEFSRCLKTVSRLYVWTFLIYSSSFPSEALPIISPNKCLHTSVLSAWGPFLLSSNCVLNIYYKYSLCHCLLSLAKFVHFFFPKKYYYSEFTYLY
jgi:hypothetical protein